MDPAQAVSEKFKSYGFCHAFPASLDNVGGAILVAWLEKKHGPPSRKADWHLLKLSGQRYAFGFRDKGTGSDAIAFHNGLKVAMAEERLLILDPERCGSGKYVYGETQRSITIGDVKSFKTWCSSNDMICGEMKHLRLPGVLAPFSNKSSEPNRLAVYFENDAAVFNFRVRWY